jgi:hypothetical protein
MKKWFSQVLTRKGTEEKTWEEKIATAQCDVFHTPEYMAAFEMCPPSEASTNFGGEACLFVFGDEDDFIVHPFFKRDLAKLPFYSSVLQRESPLYDIASPYGYAGPVAHVAHPDLHESLWKKFLIEFHEFCIRSNIVTEFVRLNPFLKNHEPLSKVAEGVRKSGVVIYINLTAEEDVIWKNMKKPNRNSITRAKRENVDISRTRSLEDINEFVKMYNETMERRNAKKMYYFPNKFYHLLFDMLKENASLFVARHEGETVSGSLFVGRDRFIHYFLSGTRLEARSLGATNLLLYEAVMWAKKQGYKIFDLGGGYAENDSLFQFKASFSKTTADFFTYRKVHDESKYRILCEAIDKYHREHKPSEVPPAQSDYFPYYRR